MWTSGVVEPDPIAAIDRVLVPIAAVVKAEELLPGAVVDTEGIV